MRVSLGVLLLITGCAGPRPGAVRLGVYPILDAAPLHVASGLGYFAEEGVQIETIEFNQGSKMMEALIAGDLDIVYDSVPQAMAMRVRGQPVRAFLSGYQSALSVLAASPKAAASLRELSGLAGKTIGVGSFGGFQHGLLLHLLRHARVPSTSVHIVTIGTGATAAAALEHGKVDAALVSGSSLRLLEQRVRGARILLDMRSAEQARAIFGVWPYPGGIGLLSTDSWLDKHGAGAAGLARAMRRAMDWIRSHTAEETYKHLPENFRSQDMAADIGYLRTITPLMSEDGRMPPGGPEAIQRMLSASIEQAAAVDPASMWTNRFLEER